MHITWHRANANYRPLGRWSSAAQDGPNELRQINGKTSDIGIREGFNGTTEEAMLERSHGNSDLGWFSPGPRP